MGKNLCFILNGKEIYMDMCLLEDEIPIFFSCTDIENNYYVALCTDIDLPGYCVVRTAITQLRDMLYGNISMRDIFTEQKFFWQVISKDGKAVNDIVTYKAMEEFDSEDLPLENAFFRLFSEELQTYANLINKKISAGCFDSFPMLTNEALIDINDGKEINVQVKYDTVSVSVESYSKAIKVECVATIKITGNLRIEYNKEENCILTREKKSVESGYMAERKVIVKDPADKKILLLAA